jgi:hypothetical protein
MFNAASGQKPTYTVSDEGGVSSLLFFSLRRAEREKKKAATGLIPI